MIPPLPDTSLRAAELTASRVLVKNFFYKSLTSCSDTAVLSVGADSVVTDQGSPDCPCGGGEPDDRPDPRATAGRRAAGRPAAGRPGPGRVAGGAGLPGARSGPGGLPRAGDRTPGAKPPP